jgi:PAS domain-containing protein
MMIASSTHFIKVNPATVKILGYSEELLNNPFNFVYGEDKPNTGRSCGNWSYYGV